MTTPIRGGTNIHPARCLTRYDRRRTIATMNLLYEHYLNTVEETNR